MKLESSGEQNEVATASKSKHLYLTLHYLPSDVCRAEAWEPVSHDN